MADDDRHIEEDGRLVVYKRLNSKFYQMRARPEGAPKYVIKSLKTADIHKAIVKARKEFHKMEAMLEVGISIYKSEMNDLLRDYVVYIKEKAEKNLMSKHIVKNHLIFVKAHFEEFFRGRTLQALNDGIFTEYSEWRTNRAGQKLGRVTMKSEMNAIRGVLVYASQRKLIRIGDVPKVMIQKGTTNDSQRRPCFTEEELRELYDRLTPWANEPTHKLTWFARQLLRSYIMIVSMTGMRTNDLIDLRWKHITIFRKVVNLRSAWYASIIVSGKPSENRKTHEVTGQPHCVNEINSWRSKCRWTEPDDLVFCFRRGMPWEASRAMKPMLKEFGLLTDAMGQERTPYSLRHTYATIRLEAGVPIHLLANQMGTSVEMIEKHYGHIRLRNEVHKLSSGLVMNIVDEFTGLKAVDIGDDCKLVYDPSYKPPEHVPIIDVYFDKPRIPRGPKPK